MVAREDPTKLVVLADAIQPARSTDIDRDAQAALVTRTQESLKDYLGQVSDDNLSEQDIDWKFIVLDYSQELTAIGTLIRRDLCDSALRQIQSNYELSSEDREVVERLYARTNGKGDTHSDVL